MIYKKSKHFPLQNIFQNIHVNFREGWSINGFANRVDTKAHFATSGPYPGLGGR